MSEFTLKNGEVVAYRELRKGDEKALSAFNDELSERSRFLFMPHGYDADTLAKVIKRVEDGNDAAFVALDGTRIIAYWFLWWFDTDFPVLGIGILDEFHGRGLGGQLMRHLLKLAENKGCQAVELTTALDNKPGLALYEKVGFQRNGQVDNLSGDGRIIKEWHMFYPIKSGVVPPPREHCAPV
jgi:ribosomal protein S18 acetylase RimI-like enzyme